MRPQFLAKMAVAAGIYAAGGLAWYTNTVVQSSQFAELEKQCSTMEMLVKTGEYTKIPGIMKEASKSIYDYNYSGWKCVPDKQVADLNKRLERIKVAINSRGV